LTACARCRVALRGRRTRAAGPCSCPAGASDRRRRTACAQRPRDLARDRPVPTRRPRRGFGHRADLTACAPWPDTSARTALRIARPPASAPSGACGSLVMHLTFGGCPRQRRPLVSSPTPREENEMGKIIVAQFVTLDGVVEDPDGSAGTP